MWSGRLHGASGPKETQARRQGSLAQAGDERDRAREPLATPSLQWARAPPYIPTPTHTPTLSARTRASLLSIAGVLGLLPPAPLLQLLGVNVGVVLSVAGGASVRPVVGVAPPRPRSRSHAPCFAEACRRCSSGCRAEGCGSRRRAASCRGPPGSSNPWLFGSDATRTCVRASLNVAVHEPVAAVESLAVTSRRPHFPQHDPEAVLSIDAAAHDPSLWVVLPSQMPAQMPTTSSMRRAGAPRPTRSAPMPLR